MRKVLQWIGTAGVLFALGSGPAWAEVQITQVVLSPQILLEIYHAYQSGISTIDWNNPNIIQLAANAQEDVANRNLAFSIEIWDGTTWVARAGVFHALSTPLHIGPNIFNANDISGSGLTLQFNSNYNPDANKLSSGGILPTGNFRVVLQPVAPTPGPAFILNFALFTPRSALNQPPIPIYPKGVSVNTAMPLFSWTTVPRAASYEVSVGPDQDTNVNTYWRSGRLTMSQSLYPPDARALENGARYYWQVKAMDGFGNPIGGVDGRSQAADFTVNSSARATTAASAADVEGALKAALKDPAVFAKLAGYQPVAIETTADDLAALLKQLADGTATVTSARVE